MNTQINAPEAAPPVAQAAAARPYIAAHAVSNQSLVAGHAPLSGYPYAPEPMRARLSARFAMPASAAGAPVQGSFFSRIKRFFSGKSRTASSVAESSPAPLSTASSVVESSPAPSSTTSGVYDDLDYDDDSDYDDDLDFDERERLLQEEDERRIAASGQKDPIAEWRNRMQNLPEKYRSEYDVEDDGKTHFFGRAMGAISRFFQRCFGKRTKNEDDLFDDFEERG
jgi:hypothetical protein